MDHFSLKRVQETKEKGLFPATSHLRSPSHHELSSPFLWQIGESLPHLSAVLPALGPLLHVLIL